ncbi:hypothetical protein [Micromonospora sp. NPDC000018]|uniref:hypothetical protein n=1 Tax=Micromonospora sp. NPDC000018 TaxID=3154239 RepID=UPI00331D76BE
MLHLRHSDFRADQHNAAPPDILSDVAAFVGQNSGFRLAHPKAMAPCAELVTDTHLATVGERAAQR